MSQYDNISLEDIQHVSVQTLHTGQWKPNTRGGYLVVKEHPLFHSTFTEKYITKKSQNNYKQRHKSCSLYALSLYQKLDERQNLFTQCNKKCKRWRAYIGDKWVNKGHHCDTSIITKQNKWRDHANTNLDYYYIFVVVNGKKYGKELRTLRDIKGKHHPLLLDIKQKVLKKTKQIYGLNENELTMYIHYLPSVHLLHFHFVSNKHPTMHAHRHRDHLLNDVLYNIKYKDPNFYQKATLDLQVFKDSSFWNDYLKMAIKEKYSYYKEWRNSLPKEPTRTDIICNSDINNKSWRPDKPKTIEVDNNNIDNKLWRSSKSNIDGNNINCNLHIKGKRFININNSSDRTCDSFEYFELSQDLLSGIYEYGLHQPWDIQRRYLLDIIKKRDIIISDTQHGSGKTITYSIGLLQRLDINVRQCQGIVVHSNKELAKKAFNNINSLGINLNIKHILCGNSLRDDIRNIQKGCHIISGTPGRINDLLKKEILNINHLKLIIIDGVEDIITKGFKNDIYGILQHFQPEKIQIIMVSMRMGFFVNRLKFKFMTNPSY